MSLSVRVSACLLMVTITLTLLFAEDAGETRASFHASQNRRVPRSKMLLARKAWVNFSFTKFKEDHQKHISFNRLFFKDTI